MKLHIDGLCGGHQLEVCLQEALEVRHPAGTTKQSPQCSPGRDRGLSA
jgi:hypothetical protein